MVVQNQQKMIEARVVPEIIEVMVKKRSGESSSREDGSDGENERRESSLREDGSDGEDHEININRHGGNEMKT